MAKEVIMPKNGMAMEEGKLIRWLKNVGDTVEKDEPLIEIETDKITMEEPSAHGGTLLAKWAEDGETVPVLAVIGWIGEAGEKIPAKPDTQSPDTQSQPEVSNALGLLPDEEPAAPAAPVPFIPASLAARAAQTSSGALEKTGTPATPYAKKLAAESGISLTSVQPTGRRGEITAADVKATPLANRVAANLGVDLSGVSGTGFGGKITSSDVKSACAPAPRQDGVRIPMTGMRKTVARNMAIAHEIPPVTEHLRADVTRLLTLRENVNSEREEKLSVNDFVVKAVARALEKHPELLVSIDGDYIIQHQNVNLGIAVSLDEGLIVPVVMDANKLGLSALSEKIKDLAARARKGGLQPHEYSGSTFTVSNMGMFGIEMFTPIINPPNAAILGVNAIVDELALKDGEVCVKKKMGLSLTFDHRLVDGVAPAKFLMTLRALLERPMEILL